MTVNQAELREWGSTAVSHQTPLSNLHTLQGSYLVSSSLLVPGIKSQTFLRHARGQQRFLWQNGSKQFTLAGFGVAAELLAWGEQRFNDIHHQAQMLFADAVVLNETSPFAAPRLFGGFAFRDDFTPDEAWSAFQPAHFILPHYQLVEQAGETWLTINALLPQGENPRLIEPELRLALQARYDQLLAMQRDADMGNGRSASRWRPLPHPAKPKINYPMPYEAWQEMIERAVQQMETTDLNKVVLSRVCELRFSKPVQVENELQQLHQHYPGCFQFLFEPRPFHAFFGATPELLARVNGRSLTTMGLAGSAPRGKTTAEDAILGQTLLNSRKDRYEHSLVVQSIRNRLTPITSKLDVPNKPDITRLNNIQHLHTPIQATLSDANGILPIVSLLHPTPALGGQPRHLAMDFIRQEEPVTRGWYAAPVGWIDHKLDGEFGVAIRSAVTQDRRVWLYAGGGIVAESNAENEWRETALKFWPVLNAFGVSDENG